MATGTYGTDGVSPIVGQHEWNAMHGLPIKPRLLGGIC